MLKVSSNSSSYAAKLAIAITGSAAINVVSDAAPVQNTQISSYASELGYIRDQQLGIADGSLMDLSGSEQTCMYSGL